MHYPNINITLSENAVIPNYATRNSAGVDLHSTESLVLEPGKRALVSTGLAIQLPSNVVAMVCPRSGLAARHGITVLNAPGIIDSDFRGEIKVILVNLGDVYYPIHKGDRIAQLVLTPVVSTDFTVVERLDTTDRGVNGFGSTGY